MNPHLIITLMYIALYWKQLPETSGLQRTILRLFPNALDKKVALTGIIWKHHFPRSFRLVQFVAAVMSVSHVGVFTFSFFGDATT